jgi:hypothetical protein
MVYTPKLFEIGNNAGCSFILQAFKVSQRGDLFAPIETSLASFS